jgi:nicotinamide phosphoribosyltransferase
MFMNNILLVTDGYKPTHWKQYPKDTTKVFSFFESRGGDFPRTTFFGLQYIIKEYLLGQQVTEEKIQEAKKFFKEYFGNEALFNEAGWRHILNVHDGYLPIQIDAVPEGLRVPTHNVLMTMVNTDPAVPWLTNYLETLLVQVWYPTTIATQSRFMKDTIMEYLEKTGDPNLIPFKLHDFGFRGSTSVESSGIGGAAHLVNFLGTDTLSGIVMLQKYYGAGMAGFSIPAAEHSTITAWGRDNEVEAYRNILKEFPTGLVACVSDSYDVFTACEKMWGEELRSEVLSRDGVLVVRPDSGHPPEVVAKVLEILGGKFGYTINSKGYRVLNPKVRAIQGDGIDRDMLFQILHRMERFQWSADNIAFGSGGGLLQKVNRDTCKFAFKCSAIERGEGNWEDVMKDPITDPGKKSKAGRLFLVEDMHGEYKTVTPDHRCLYKQEITRPVYLNGHLLIDQNIAEIRERASL